MPSVGTELCGQVAFGGDPLWVDASSAVSCSSNASACGLQRLPLVSLNGVAAGHATGTMQRCPQFAAVSGGCSDGTGRYVHLVSVTGRAEGTATDTAIFRRIGQLGADATAVAGGLSAMRRIVQYAADGKGQGIADTFFQRCPQLRSDVVGMAKAWFVPITVMGRAERRGSLCRIVQHALDARIQSVQGSSLVRLCQANARANGGTAAQALVSLLAMLPLSAVAGTLADGRLSGTWGLSITGKAQALVEVYPVRLVPLHPSAGVGMSASVAGAHCLVGGIGPALSFAPLPADCGVILFEVER